MPCTHLASDILQCNDLFAFNEAHPGLLFSISFRTVAGIQP